VRGGLGLLGRFFFVANLWGDCMADFLGTNPNSTVTVVVPADGARPGGEEVVILPSNRACASSIRFSLPAGGGANLGGLGWLHPGLRKGFAPFPTYEVGRGQLVVANVEYLYVPGGNPLDVIRGDGSANSPAPNICWGFWRTRYYGALNATISYWF